MQKCKTLGLQDVIAIQPICLWAWRSHMIMIQYFRWYSRITSQHVKVPLDRFRCPQTNSYTLLVPDQFAMSNMWQRFAIMAAWGCIGCLSLSQMFLKLQQLDWWSPTHSLQCNTQKHQDFFCISLKNIYIYIYIRAVHYHVSIKQKCTPLVKSLPRTFVFF